MVETETIARCQRGERAAFYELFSGYRDSAFRFSLGLLGNRQDALDVVQEAFMAAFNGIRRLDPERGFAGWFYGILRHLCSAQLRQRRTVYDPETLILVQDPRPSPEAVASGRERRQAVLNCVEQLTPVQREVIVLREFEGLSYEEIAARLEVPLGTVMSRLYDARRAMGALIRKNPLLKQESLT